ncbi:hypothetical protein [Aphanizomenon flos-aquae]|uniref:Uncharacterized protein n=1 Tax=Aphanizomenon flos-aquae FACHB-1040 TaxID=2692887 RepID=A0ABR8C3U6_APHFL|nr:hypothetical protein [Aphanizomenon flos-aquae]MBD2280462.1 hypothetical protein [Aphanizomenon flos-aquae FACHB-1040]
MAGKKLDKLKLMVVDDELDNLDVLYRTFWKDFNPHSAPPSVTIGNFGFLNTFDDNFDTKLSKS